MPALGNVSLYVIFRNFGHYHIIMGNGENGIQSVRTKNFAEDGNRNKIFAFIPTHDITYFYFLVIIKRTCNVIN